MSSNTTEHGEHFNESIVNEVILEDMKKNRIDHMKYLPGMETMEESDVMEQVITAMNAYDYDKYTEKDVRRALEHDNRTVEDFQALLSPAALPLLEEIAQAARVETRKHFGNSVYMFTPIYIANYCENYCIYCGFNCHNKIRRAQLNEEEIEKEILSIIQKNGGTVDNLAMINEELKNRYNGFDLKDYGYSRVSGFLRSIKGLSVDGNVVRIKK